MVSTLLSEYSFETVNMLTRSHTASDTFADDSPESDFNANNWNIETDESDLLGDCSTTYTGAVRRAEIRSDL